MNEAAEAGSSAKHAYVPDFQTAFVQSQAHQRKLDMAKPYLGQSSVGADSLQLLEEKRYQAEISQSYGMRGDVDRSAYQGVKPALPADTWLHQQIAEVRERERAAVGLSTLSSDVTPAVGADAFLLRAQKEAGPPPPRIRNQHNLAAGMGKPTIKGDTWMMEWLNGAKKDRVMKGAVKKEWVGVKGTATKEGDLFATHAKEAQAALPSRNGVYASKPKEREAFQGIKPHVTTEDYVLSAYKGAREAIRLGDQHQASLIPLVQADDFMIEHARGLAAVATAPKRTRWPFSAGRKIAPWSSESAR